MAFSLPRSRSRGLRRRLILPKQYLTCIRSSLHQIQHPRNHYDQMQSRKLQLFTPHFPFKINTNQNDYCRIVSSQRIF
uniref:Putative ovule protein n=1 Tax=Solanum chacoense TaxID=4108 RepID=A0A0V0HCG7_SOLCH